MRVVGWMVVSTCLCREVGGEDEGGRWSCVLKEMQCVYGR